MTVKAGPVAKWPRLVWCCCAPGCGYVQAVGSLGTQCPAHRTLLVPLHVKLADPQDFIEAEMAAGAIEEQEHPGG